MSKNRQEGQSEPRNEDMYRGVAVSTSFEGPAVHCVVFSSDSVDLV